jgi:hypothetical protein
LDETDVIKRKWSFVTVIILIVGGVACEPGVAHAATANSDIASETKCKLLVEADFSSIQDAPTQITAAKIVPAEGAEPTYCQVQGYVAPQVGFELRLPTANWNGKFIEIGCGGACGTTGWLFWCPVRRGYACMVSDMGHRGKDQDMLWSYNALPAQLDFDIRGPHVAALAGKAITRHFYNQMSGKAYFMGCSNGGVQALSEAQRFPWDFDGIIDVAGAASYSDLNPDYLWSVRALQELRMVHAAAVARCDLDDGVKDGVIGNPRACKFDPAELICRSGQTSQCLTGTQAEAVRKVYDGPTTSNGEKKSYLRGFERGSELGWIKDVLPAGPGGLDEWTREVFRYIGFTPAPGPKWNIQDFNFDEDYKRLGVSGALLDPSNPDLRKFKAAGGKLISVQGWSDSDVFPASHMDYYDLVEKTMGGRAPTQAFYRLFMVPGMAHCSGGEGAFAIDYLTYMENWAERGQAPDKMIGAHVDTHYLADQTRRAITQADGNDTSELSEDLLAWGGAIELKFPLDPTTPISWTRPIYPYPIVAKYKGTGDSNKAESFGPVAP